MEGKLGLKIRLHFPSIFHLLGRFFWTDISYKFPTDEQLTNEVMANEKER